MVLEFKDEIYSWSNISLLDFLSEGNIPRGWKDFFLDREILQELTKISEYLSYVAKDKIIYPPINSVFRAMYEVPVDKIKAILIGQDCYHNGNTEYDGSATGLCFSVRCGNTINPSLKNIYKEMRYENIDTDNSGDLSYLATRESVLMLNMALTVTQGEPGSHKKVWEKFTNKLVKYIAKKNGELHWILLGKDAHKISEYIDNGIFHCRSHCSPLAAKRKCGKYEAFLGSNIFHEIPSVYWGKRITKPV